PLIRQTFGIPGATPILSWVGTTHTVNIDFSFAKNIQLSRPFNLDLASAGLPSFLTNLVGVSASGNVDVRASLQLDVKLGLDLDGSEGTSKGFFLRVGSTGTKLSASASVAGTNLAFDARLGPFGLFVINGNASAGAGIDL